MHFKLPIQSRSVSQSPWQAPSPVPDQTTNSKTTTESEGGAVVTLEDVVAFEVGIDEALLAVATEVGKADGMSLGIQLGEGLDALVGKVVGSIVPYILPQFI
jgi:hypothetical protein